MLSSAVFNLSILSFTALKIKIYRFLHLRSLTVKCYYVRVMKHHMKNKLDEFCAGLKKKIEKHQKL